MTSEERIIKNYHAAICEMKKHEDGISQRFAKKVCEDIGVNNTIFTMLKKMNEVTVNPNGLFSIKRNDTELLARECRAYTMNHCIALGKLRSQKLIKDKPTPITKTFPMDLYSDGILIKTLKERGYSISRTETVKY